MARKVLVQHPDGSTFDLTETPVANEHHLQEVMKTNPALLPVDDLGITGPLLVVGRETSLASGSIDLVGAVPSGDLVLVEFKTGPQNPDFRHALAQLIDYGSELWGTTAAEFDTGVVQRYLNGLPPRADGSTERTRDDRYVAQSVATQPKTHRSMPVPGVDEASFLADLDDVAYRDALSDIFTTCRTLGLSFAWGVRGASIRLATPDRPEPLSVGWIFPNGSNWSGLHHLTLGYDEQSAKYTPSIADALECYTDEVSRINGGTAAKAKTLRAWTFNPTVVPEAKEAIIGALEALVQKTSGDEG